MRLSIENATKQTKKELTRKLEELAVKNDGGIVETLRYNRLDGFLRGIHLVTQELPEGDKTIVYLAMIANNDIEALAAEFPELVLDK